MSELPVISEIPVIDRKSIYEQRTSLFFWNYFVFVFILIKMNLWVFN